MSAKYRMSATWRILPGDCRDTLAELPEGSVQTCVTSPPYFGLRDYGHDGQIGLEPTPDEFVQALVEVFRGVRRVLRDDGTVWLNLGDSYASNGRGDARSGLAVAASKADGIQRDIDSWQARTNEIQFCRPNTVAAGFKPKDLLGVPWMVAFALRADGWYLRSDIIWSKPNPMPESVTDRPTKAHEHLFLLSKGPRYFYDAAAIREDAAAAEDYARRSNPGPTGRGLQAWTSGSGTAQQDHSGWIGGDGAGRNRRSVWTVDEEEWAQFLRWKDEQEQQKPSVWMVATQPYAGAHFATFPPKLIEPCILAGSREGDTVLDPFSGSGTTGMVALRHGRSYIGCELSAEYVELSRRRITDDAPLLNSGAEMAA